MGKKSLCKSPIVLQGLKESPSSGVFPKTPSEQGKSILSQHKSAKDAWKFEVLNIPYFMDHFSPAPTLEHKSSGHLVFGFGTRRQSTVDILDTVLLGVPRLRTYDTLMSPYEQ